MKPVTDWQSSSFEDIAILLHNLTIFVSNELSQNFLPPPLVHTAIKINSEKMCKKLLVYFVAFFRDC